MVVSDRAVWVLATPFGVGDGVGGGVGGGVGFVLAAWLALFWRRGWPGWPGGFSAWPRKILDLAKEHSRPGPGLILGLGQSKTPP